MTPRKRNLDRATPPAGFLYRPDFITKEEERELLEHLTRLPFSEIRMHGIIAKRRTVHFGWVYGYESWRIAPGPPIPAFLQPVRERAAALVDTDPADFAEALVTHYPAGAGIGWHRDAPMFGPVVVGISLVGACRFHFRCGTSAARGSFSITLEPRSAYVLQGPARSAWQHRIPSTKGLRYSITFRTLHENRRQSPEAPTSFLRSGARSG
jgi:alkylated DNA repair dioxygenase AlkB